MGGVGEAAQNEADGRGREVSSEKVKARREAREEESEIGPVGG